MKRLLSVVLAAVVLAFGGLVVAPAASAYGLHPTNNCYGGWGLYYHWNVVGYSKDLRTGTKYKTVRYTNNITGNSHLHNWICTW